MDAVGRGRNEASAFPFGRIDDVVYVDVRVKGGFSFNLGLMDIVNIVASHLGRISIRMDINRPISVLTINCAVGRYRLSYFSFALGYFLLVSFSSSHIHL